jgi:hypothetical protein
MVPSPAISLGQIPFQSKEIQEELMKRALQVIFLLVIVNVIPARAQSPNFDVGPVWRITDFHIKPGMGDAFWKDFREHIKPVLDEQKKLGLISDYKLFTNPTSNKPDDWDVAIGVLYPNWAAIDQLDAKAATVVVKHYGSREATFEMARKRSDIRDVVSSHLVREVTPK